jgi:hypothetical protein
MIGIQPGRRSPPPTRQGVLRRGGQVADVTRSVVEVESSEVGCRRGGRGEAAASAGWVKRCSSVRCEGAMGV